MGFVGGVFRCGTVVALLLAALASFVARGGLRTLGVAEKIEMRIDSEGHQRFIGFSPALHAPEWRFQFADLPALDGQVVLVTGANVGLGYWSALHLARRGAKVLLGCRTPTKCEIAVATIRHNLTDAPVKSGSVQCLKLDLSKFSSVKEAALEVLKEKRLDQLMLNAGMVSPSYRLSRDGVEIQWHSNVVGHQQLYTLLSPLLEKTASAQGHATVTVLSSSAHFEAQRVHSTIESVNNATEFHALHRYRETKAANLLFMHEAVRRLPKGSKVLINSVHPGLVATEFQRDVEEAFINWFGATGGVVLWRVLSVVVGGMAWTAEDGALTQVWASASKEMREKRHHNKYYHPVSREVAVCRHMCTNAESEKAQWQFVEQLIASKSK